MQVLTQLNQQDNVLGSQESPRWVNLQFWFYFPLSQLVRFSAPGSIVIGVLNPKRGTWGSTRTFKRTPGWFGGSTQVRSPMSPFPNLSLPISPPLHPNTPSGSPCLVLSAQSTALRYHTLNLWFWFTTGSHNMQVPSEMMPFRLPCRNPIGRI
ncbi:uncharacterized protein N7483_009267 [Penicillium malachiteum]|uniref:uncharacterized protein n=1 Tax=Penicillium malachiteum TaxID=1324776 RepID=UPI002547F7FA|nr:uncharacterized protein N7483_009267 [Penicillium malachiteum]KAJ5721333.1 hypothetical protein N7483_009267 [Penicillium malachiteum]